MDYDVIVVGGSYAGLSAALTLGRARKRTLIIDAGERRNRFAHEAHVLLGHDGRDPGEIVRMARAEVAAYPTSTFQAGEAVAAEQIAGGFRVTLANGSARTALRLILATGVVDELPDLPGMREAWGSGVLHCPYCHGYEVADRRLGVLALMPIATHQAHLIPEWGPTTFLTNGVIALGQDERDALLARGVTIEDETVVEIISRGGALTGVRLRDGRVIALDAVFTGVPTRLTSPLAEQLGCAIDETVIGPIIRIDPMGQTTVPGVFAAGDAAMMMKSLPGAVTGGNLAGLSAHRSLIPGFH